MAVLGAGSNSGYPGALDTVQSFSNVASPIADGPTRIDAEVINDVLDAIVKIETELGTDPAGSYTDVKTRLDTYLPTTGSAFTAGSVIYATSGGKIAQENDKLFWHEGNNTLLINTNVAISSTEGILIADKNLRIADTDGSTSVELRMDARHATLVSRDLTFQTAGVDRWFFRCTSEAEGGSDTGSNLNLLRRADAGTALGTPISIARNTGVFTLNGGGSTNFVFNNGKLFINDTDCANVTTGLVINQGAADDYAFVLKSSDVAHALTGVMETDSYFAVKKDAAATGGVAFTSIAETAAATPMTFHTWGGQPPTSAGGSSAGIFNFIGHTHDGAAAETDISANGNVFTVRKGSAATTLRTLFIIDAEGDLFVDGSGTLTAFDEYDDVKLLTSAKALTLSPNMKEQFSEWIEESKDILTANKVLSIDEQGNPYISYKGLSGLIIDAIRQLNTKIETQNTYIAQLQTRLLEV